METSLLLNVQETARLLGVSTKVIYRLTKSGDIPSLMLGGSIRVPREALTRWIDASTTARKEDEKDI